MTDRFVFDPDYVVPPGATLREALEERDTSQANFALRTGLTEKEWLRGIPVAELVGRGYIPLRNGTSSMIREVLRFFQVRSVDAWKTVWEEPQIKFRARRKARGVSAGSAAAWLRMGELEAAKIECGSYDEQSFKKALLEVRGMTTVSPNEWKLRVQKRCAAAGVAVIWIKEMPKSGVSGITRWLSKEKALILLGLKFKRNEQVSFSFFHEACHVLKHGKKLTFYEIEKPAPDELELEADEFAAGFLTPREHVGSSTA